MSCWIEFHASRIKKLLKFQAFRKTLNWSANEALGFLGSFWGEIIELREDGDISGWTPEYIAELTDAKIDPERLWKALEVGWIDKASDGKTLVHDWLDCAGFYLRKKYSSGNKERLVRIWGLHGRVYGSNGGDREATEERPESDTTKPDLTTPDQTKDKTPLPPRGGEVEIPEDLKVSEAEIQDWLEYKRQKKQKYQPGKGLDALWRAFRLIPVEERRAAVDHSMANNWAGLYERKGAVPNAPRTAGYAAPGGTHAGRIIDN
jgi:hypothetical protein